MGLHGYLTVECDEYRNKSNDIVVRFDSGSTTRLLFAHYKQQ